MSTFIGQLVGFAVIVWLVWRYVVPPVRKLMTDQQNTVRQQLADSSAAADRLAEASRAHAKAKEDANAEAQRLTEEAQSRCRSASVNNCVSRPRATRSGSSSRAPSRRS